MPHNSRSDYLQKIFLLQEIQEMPLLMHLSQIPLRLVPPVPVVYIHFCLCLRYNQYKFHKFLLKPAMHQTQVLPENHFLHTVYNHSYNVLMPDKIHYATHACPQKDEPVLYGHHHKNPLQH